MKQMTYYDSKQMSVEIGNFIYDLMWSEYLHPSENFGDKFHIIKHHIVKHLQPKILKMVSEKLINQSSTQMNDSVYMVMRSTWRVNQ